MKIVILDGNTENSGDLSWEGFEQLGSLTVYNCAKAKDLMDLSAAIILLCPVFFPVIQAFGIDPLFFGIITVVSLGIGLVTPPVGACLFIACKIGNVPLYRGGKASIPFILAIFLILLLFVQFPQIVLAVPNALM